VAPIRARNQPRHHDDHVQHVVARVDRVTSRLEPKPHGANTNASERAVSIAIQNPEPRAQRCNISAEYCSPEEADRQSSGGSTHLTKIASPSCSRWCLTCAPSARIHGRIHSLRKDGAGANPVSPSGRNRPIERRSAGRVVVGIRARRKPAGAPAEGARHQSLPCLPAGPSCESDIGQGFRC
jgi:hypothetical protein